MSELGFEVLYRGETSGPYSPEDFISNLKSGALSVYSLARETGSAQWRPAAEYLREFQEAQSRQFVPVPPPLPVLPPELSMARDQDPNESALVIVPDLIPDLPQTAVTYLQRPQPLSLRQKVMHAYRWLPWPVRFVVTMGLTGFVLFGTAGAGFVSAVTGGIPVFLAPIVVAFAFMIVGIITTFQAIFRDPKSGAYLGVVMGMIARDIAIRRATDDLQKAMAAKPAVPEKQDFPDNVRELREFLLKMDPFLFEKHVMSFFTDAGMVAWVTKKSNDAGVDGFARHPKGLIVVQCKRNSPKNGVGRPVVQQLKGVVLENKAWCGIIVTTSYFTREASESGRRSDRLILVDMDKLIEWHRQGLILE